MKHYRLEGIVIKRVNYKEADRIIVLFSKEAGKVKILGKGVRKIISRRSSHLEIFSYVKVFVKEGRYLPYITEAELIYGFSQLRKNLRKVVIAYHLCEIINALLPEREKNENIFYLLVDTLHKIENEDLPDKTRKAVRIFVNNLLIQLGFVNPNKTFSYSQLINEIENLYERPLLTLRLLTKIKKFIQ